ncbi:unnamed protein product, partial [Musa acuminata subsp. burmannicoides]
ASSRFTWIRQPRWFYMRILMMLHRQTNGYLILVSAAFYARLGCEIKIPTQK